MHVKRYLNIDSFLQENLSFLEKNEAANNLPLGIPLSIPRLQALEQPLNLFSVQHEGEVIFSAAQTPPHNLLISGHPDYTSEILNAFIPFLKDIAIEITGVIGDRHLALAFAKAWEIKTGQTWKINFRQLVHQLDQLQDIRPTSGQLRKATLNDLPIVEQWIIDFALAAMNSSNPEKSKAIASAKIETGQIYLWEDQIPVSMAAVARPTRNGITVNYVYTPPEHRGKGYASNCVYAMSEKMLEAYKFCCLFTDETNPTSNKIYQAMGYYPVAEFYEIKFKQPTLGF